MWMLAQFTKYVQVLSLFLEIFTLRQFLSIVKLLDRDMTVSFIFRLRSIRQPKDDVERLNTDLYAHAVCFMDRTPKY